jgi:hypothetical protein
VLRIVSWVVWKKYKRHNKGVEEIPSSEYSHIKFKPIKKGRV